MLATVLESVIEDRYGISVFWNVRQFQMIRYESTIYDIWEDTSRNIGPVGCLSAVMHLIWDWASFQRHQLDGRWLNWQPSSKESLLTPPGCKARPWQAQRPRQQRYVRLDIGGACMNYCGSIRHAGII